eukprot:m.137094 g.137094  ORF g.137094 m.137094 type:complete len:142 (+) comp16042_c0_seq1:3196-3621(+)
MFNSNKQLDIGRSFAGNSSSAMQMSFTWSYQVTILFDSWTTTNAADFGLACVLVAVASYGCECLRGYREQLEQDCREGKKLQAGHKYRTAIAALLFAYSYLLMLVAMTYSYGLFLSLIVGYSIAFTTVTHVNPGAASAGCH